MAKPNGLVLIGADTRENWLEEWAAYGVALLERYLAKHAAFADYLRTREVRT